MLYIRYSLILLFFSFYNQLYSQGQAAGTATKVETWKKEVMNSIEDKKENSTGNGGHGF